MKNTICGFDQKMLLEFGLDLKDAMLLRYFVDFRETESMTSIVVNEKSYYWLNYKHMKEDIPIIGIQSNDTLRRRMKKLEECKILGHYHSLKGGSYSYYCLGKNYDLLIKSDKKVVVVKEKSSTPTTEEKEQNNLTTKDNINIDSEEIWSLYPNKKGKVEAMNKIPKILNSIGKDRLRQCVLDYCEEVKGRDKRYILNGSTFFKSRYQDYLRKQQEIDESKDEEDNFLIELEEDM